MECRQGRPATGSVTSLQSKQVRGRSWVHRKLGQCHHRYNGAASQYILATYTCDITSQVFPVQIGVTNLRINPISKLHSTFIFKITIFPIYFIIYFINPRCDNACCEKNNIHSYTGYFLGIIRYGPMGPCH